MLTYDDFVKTDAARIEAAYRQKYKQTIPTPAVFHNAWRLLREGWDIEAVIADLLQPGSGNGAGAHPEEMLPQTVPPPPEYRGFLHVQGNRFVADDGTPIPLLGYTNHTLIASIAKGEDVTPRLLEAKGYGYTSIITIGCHLSPWKRDNGFYYDPRRGDHRDILAHLFDVCAAQGLRVAFAALADVQDVSRSDQQAIWHTAQDVADGRWNALLRIGNEAGANGWYPPDFEKRALGGVLQSKGSAGADTIPHLPPWDFTEYESRRDLPKALLDANCLELAYGGWDALPHGISGPIVNIEPAYFNDTETDWCGDRGRWTDPALAYALGAQIGLGCAGGGFGASDGLVNRPLQPRAAACAKAFARGLTDGFAK